MKIANQLIIKFIPFWIYLIFFKCASALYYFILTPLGEKLMPIWIVGILMGAQSILQLIFDVPAGYILDRYGYRRLLKITTICFMLSALALSFGFNVYTYVLSLFLSVFGWLFFGPGVNAYVLSHTPKESAGRFLSMKDIFTSMGTVASTIIFPFIVLAKTQFMGWLVFLSLMISLTFIFLSPKDHVKATIEKKVSTHHYYIRRDTLMKVFRTMRNLDPASSTLALLRTAASIFYATVWFIVPLIIAHQAQAGILGIGLGIFDLTIIVLGFALGNLADLMDKRLLVFLGLLIFAVGGMGLGFNFGWIFILIGMLATIGNEMADISLWTWIHSINKERDGEGLISGVINLCDDLGWSIGTVYAGFAFFYFGPSWAILISAIPILLTWIVYHFKIKDNINYLSGIKLYPIKPHFFRYKK